MVDATVAFLATLAALGCAGLLFMRALADRRIPLIAWSLTLCTLGVALGAMAVGFAMGFSPALLRAMELSGALLAPLTLVLGVVELVARTVQARFAARLIAASYVVVAVVIILLDPIIGRFDESLPKVSGHYSSLPKLVLDGGHVFAVVSLLSCVAVTALRGNRRDRQAMETMLPVAMVALAGVLVVTATRGFLPGPLAPLALGGAIALVWFGAARLLPDRADDDDDDYDDEAEPQDEMAHYGGRPPQRQPQHGYPHPTNPANPANLNPANPASPPGGLPPHGGPRGGQPPFAPMPFAPPGQYGRITMYTLIDGHQDAFDRLAAEVIQAVREREPGTLVYTGHTVDNAPAQRIFYQLFRDGAAVEAHTRQPHVQRFAGEARVHVAATNVIELTVSAGKVSAPYEPPPPGAHQGVARRPAAGPPTAQPPGGPRPPGRPAPGTAVRWPRG